MALLADAVVFVLLCCLNWLLIYVLCVCVCVCVCELVTSLQTILCIVRVNESMSQG